MKSGEGFTRLPVQNSAVPSDPIPDQPHIDKIREALWHGIGHSRAALMVGAGFSLNARSESSSQISFPTWFDLMQGMINEIVVSDRDQLGLKVASRSVSGALRIAEEYVALHGRANLDAFLQARVPDHNFQPGNLHLQALKLPWSDVFTTNWDTLLERTALQLIERRYSVVLEVTDISHRMRPRIIKLHGSFPSNGPFILTEEDFRTYPQKFAPYVNLVQQSMMENIVCLVGFSGDDPNFLSWSGWVRDNLARHRPRIYLCGVLNLRPGERMVLEGRGVIPIDLSEIFGKQSSVSEGDRDNMALEWFFDNLLAGKPPESLSWPDSGKPPPNAGPGLPRIPPYSGVVPRREQVLPD